jgi:site-specific recombinase XerD
VAVDPSGWSKEAAQRVRFVLDFSYATGLRATEFTAAVLGNIEINARDEAWLHLMGKGAKKGKVGLPPLARVAVDDYLIQRGLPVSPSLWKPATPILARLDDEFGGALSAEKLSRATPHWMRHTHATHALERGADLTTVRDNLRHASLATTSTYLHSDEIKRSRELASAFRARVSTNSG